MRTEHKHGRCETCKHYVSEYAPYIRRIVMTCELPKRNARCEGNYEFKEEDDVNDA